MLRRRLPRRAARLGSGLVAVLVLSCLPGCGSGHDESLLGDGSAATPAVRSPPSARATEVTTAKQLLRQRAAAVLSGNEQAFLEPVVSHHPAFLAQQRLLFANLRQLPVQALSFTISATHRVERSLTLSGFDSGPLVGAAGFEVRRRAGHLAVVPPQADDERGTDPWDLVPIRTLSTSSVLLVADRGTPPAELQRVVRAVADGIYAVAGVVPGGWDRRAVVYVFDDPTVLASYARVPGGNLEHLGSVTFPVRGGASGERVVGGRIALLPAALRTDDAGLHRLVRHELTHLALGTSDDQAPTWLAEGIAEYIAAGAMPPADQRIATVAVTRAKTGFYGLPPAATFNDAEQDLHYAEAWMACDYLAHTRGDPILFDLLNAMDRAHVGRAGAGQDAVLERMVGLDGQQLADKAAHRTLRLFAPRAASAAP